MKFSWFHLLPLCLKAAAGIYVSEPASDEGCSTLELVIARGVHEPLNPSFGIIVGDPLFLAVQKLIPEVIGYPVNYPATLDCDSVQIGVNDTLTHLSQKAQQCPSMSYALVGFNEGAAVMHEAGPSIPTSLVPSIVALVMFADPGNKGGNVTTVTGAPVPAFPAALAQRLRQNCAAGDPICSNGSDATAVVSYDDANTTYIPDSAAYIFAQASSDGEVGPEEAVGGGGGGSSSAASASGNAAALSALLSLLSTTAPVCSGMATVAAGGPSNRTTSATASATASASAGSNLPTTSAFNSLASLTVTTPLVTFTGGAAPRMKILW